MGFGFKQPLVGEKRCVTTLITAAKETSAVPKVMVFELLLVSILATLVPNRVRFLQSSLKMGMLY